MYVKYGNGSEIQTVPVESNGTISIVVPANATALSRVTTRANKEVETNNIFNYPGYGNGTIMFEDMYPALGDYDFNDFVAWYRYCEYEWNEWKTKSYPHDSLNCNEI